MLHAASFLAKIQSSSGSGELIAEAGHGNDKARAFGIVFHLLPQAANMYVNGSSERIFVVSPDFSKKRLPR